MPNGNYLFCYSDGAREVTQAKTTVWEYKAPVAEKVEVHACQPLPDGRVLVVECGPSRIIEVDRSGAIVRELKLHPTAGVQLHNQFRGTRKLSNGHYLVCFKGDGKVLELDGIGQVLREAKVPGDPHEVVALPNGHWLVDCGDGHKIIELNAQNEEVWTLNENDLPGHPLRLVAGCQRLPNGNTVFCNYLGHGHLGEQAQVIEITPAKQVVWEFRNEALLKTVNQIQLLDVPGDVTLGEILR
jgi:hypothetical protein